MRKRTSKDSVSKWSARVRQILRERDRILASAPSLSQAGFVKAMQRFNRLGAEYDRIEKKWSNALYHRHVMHRNPGRSDLSWDEAERLGILKRAGLSKPEATIKAFEVSWYSSLKNRRVGFIRPIVADTKSEAIAIARSMIDNDPKAKAFLAKAVQVNPRRHNGIVEAAAGLQALEYIGAKAKRGGLGRKPKYNPRRPTQGRAEIPGKSAVYPKKWQLRKAVQKTAAQLRKIDKMSPVWKERLAAHEQAIRDYWEYVDAWQRHNPRAKGSRDAFGVWHAENPSGWNEPALKTNQTFKIFFRESAAQPWAEVGSVAAKSVHTAIQKWRRRNKVSGHVTAKRASQANPSVQEVSRMFQGDTNGDVKNMHASDSAPGNLARIGRLVFLQVEGQRRPLRLPGAMVAADTRGRLWIVGTRAPLFNQKAKPGEALDFGELRRICYDTAKAHIGNGKRFEYVHEFGEDGGKRPHLLIDHEGMPILRGGDYKLEARGIVN